MNSRTARLYEYGGALLVLLVRIFTAPRTPWENDEFLFTEAVRNFDPSRYHPHPPGFPLFVLLGKLLHIFVNDPWRALVVVNIIAAPIGFIALTRALRNWIGDEQVAAAASLIYFLSASMMIHGPLALSDPVAMTFVALALAAISAESGEGRAEERRARSSVSALPSPPDNGHERAAILAGLWTSCAIGCRPQLVIPLAPLLAIAIWRMRTHRQRFACLATFGIVSLMWLLPLMDAAGGFDGLMAYETKQAQYFATHDAVTSRGVFSASAVVIRFLIHPWGSKYLTLPLLVFIILGASALARRWRVMLPLLAFTVVQAVFELATMDPADGARYSLPIMIVFALAAALGLEVIARSVHVSFIPIGGALLFAIASFAYIAPIIRARVSGPSPPAAAAAYVKATFPSNTIVLFDLSMRPVAESLLPEFKSESFEPALKTYYDQTGIPLVLLADGGSHAPGVQVFSWPECDAYGKLTRNHYRVVTADPISTSERYAPIGGAYQLERNIAGDEWRWLAPRAAIALPRGFDRVTVTLQLSHDTPYDLNEVLVMVNGKPEAKLTVTKQPTSATVDLLPLLPPEIEFAAARSFKPAEVLKNRDPRTLAVQLVRVEQR